MGLALANPAQPSPATSTARRIAFKLTPDIKITYKSVS
jgi:hypothetical protein